MTAEFLEDCANQRLKYTSRRHLLSMKCLIGGRRFKNDDLHADTILYARCRMIWRPEYVRLQDY